MNATQVSASAATLNGVRHAVLHDPGPRVVSSPALASWVPPGYAMQELLGTGGMAAVYRARDLQSGKVVALKVMQDKLTADGGLVARFRREILAISRLHHPNIVSVVDVGHASETPYMAVELVDGGSLQGLMAELGTIPPAIAALLIDDLLCGLSYAHAHGLVHRDLKPANLLLTLNGHLKVNDFGIASAGGASAQTRPGEIIGTPSYMSPEQALGLRVSPASDLFSVGTVLYEMLTGVNPFSHESESLTLTKVTTASVTPIFEADPTVPAGLERLLHVLLQADPARRCQTSEEALCILHEARAQIPSPPEERMRRVVVEPRATADLTRASHAHADLVDAQVQHASGTPARAAFLAFRARTVASDSAAEELLASLCLRYGYSFHGVPASSLRALEVKLRASPLAVKHIKNAADVSWHDGELLRAAALLKRYLHLRPDDEVARQRLASIVGDDVGIPQVCLPAGAPPHRLTTLDMVADSGWARALPQADVPAVVYGKDVPVALLVFAASAAVAPMAAIAYPITLGVLVAVAATAWVVRVARARRHERTLREVFASGGTPPPKDGSAGSEDTAHGWLRPASVPPAIPSVLRALASQGSGFPYDDTVDMLLQRAAASLALEERVTALTDLEVAEALMPSSDARREVVTRLIGHVRRLQCTGEYEPSASEAG